MHLRDACGATHEQHLVNLISAHTRIVHSFVQERHEFAESGIDELFELRARDNNVKIFAIAELSQKEPGFEIDREGNLGAFALSLESSARLFISTHVNAVLFLELFEAVDHESLVEVATTQIHVAFRCLHVYQTFADRQDANVKSAATKIENNDVLLVVFFMNICRHSCRSRLVYHAQDFEAGCLRCNLSRRLLIVVEVGGHGDDGVTHFLLQFFLSDQSHAGQHTTRHLLNPLVLAIWARDKAAAILVSYNRERPVRKV